MLSLSFKVLNSGRIAIFTIAKNYRQMQPIQAQLQLFFGFGNIKNHYIMSEIAVTNLFLKPCFHSYRLRLQIAMQAPQILIA